MPETTERDEFCRVEEVSEDWFAPSDAMDFWTKKNSRRALERMWAERPQSIANVCVLPAKRSLDKRFLDQGGVARAADIWPIKVALRTIPSRVDWLTSEIQEVVLESTVSGEVPVDEGTARMAIKFASTLPSFLPAPEIAADPDGEVSFDWLGSSNNMFSVSVDRNGRLAYAGRFSGGRKTNGVEQLSDVCPPEVLLGIEKAAN